MKKKIYQCPRAMAVIPMPDAMMEQLPIDASNPVKEGDAKRHESWMEEGVFEEQPEIEYKSLWD